MARPRWQGGPVVAPWSLGLCQDGLRWGWAGAMGLLEDRGKIQRSHNDGLEAKWQGTKIQSPSSTSPLVA